MIRAPSNAGGDAGWKIRDGWIPLDRPRVMGILNLTPDSFSDGGELAGLDHALRRAEVLLEEGAWILDLGGESTRPGALEVPADEQIRRVVPAIEAIARRWSVAISIDTRSTVVARAALDAGAHIVNDVSGFTFDSELPDVVARTGAGVVLMHMRGTPATMQRRTSYEMLLPDIMRELGRSLERAEGAGVDRASIVLDPGIGFSKTTEQSLLVLRELKTLLQLGPPLLVGPSRKSFLGEILDRPPRERVTGTAAACVMAYLGGARVFRVHDVRPTLEALQVAVAVAEADLQAGVGVKEAMDPGEDRRVGLTPWRKTRTTR